MADASEGDIAPANVWLPGLVERFASCLDPTFVACTLRLVDKATAEQFRGRPEYPSTVRLSQPVPPHAFAARWAPPGAMRDLTLEQRKQMLRLTAASGVVANLEMALEAAGFIPDSEQQEELLWAATAEGQAATVHCILGCGYGEAAAVDKTLSIAASAGHQSVCEVLLGDDRSPGVSLDHVAAALRGGHPELADWLLQRRPEEAIGPADCLAPLGGQGAFELLRAATEGCELPTLQAIHRRCYGVVVIGGDDVILSIAARSSTADWRAKVEWWESQLPPETLRQDPRVCTAAASCPDATTRLLWLLGRGYPAERSASEAALHAGNTAALELLLRRGLRPHIVMLGYHAAATGRLEALQKLREHGCQLAAAAVGRIAAREGKLPVLVWAVEELGASVQVPEVVDAAECRCDLEALRWLWQCGCPLDAGRVALWAAAHGRLPVLEWAAEQLGASMQSADLMCLASSSGSVEMMAWLRERGCPWGPGAFAAAAGAGSEAVLEWLVERGCPMPIDGKPYQVAARNGDLAILRCLARLGCPWGPVSGAEAVFESCLDRPCPPLRVLCPVSWLLAPPAVRRSYHLPLSVLRLLVELGCTVDWEAVRRRATSSLPEYMRDWLLTAAAAAAAQGVAHFDGGAASVGTGACSGH
ncbi:hypothetical protein GPECTOR_25g357 [Gonium pectorale]|uniref:Ankyrin repeat domain-containing protein n=1 Tax=Gonium pectorale TaxID=33097 RepID=A0A150GG58_GONPE|nr:hypothetical protein GPECTOR_25g357 [Gonium pectorale]|eukprot:KXZ48773.1 hypothetical protein GPECTOR_25g357 [Gonium pectorale]